mmetsp:Transcript_41143/g.113425  ORF Transcript_41143/g.113425 Transcript_41143/m.113425 type:complete len:201 (+) Transcript_41143:210-812(+)
MRGLFVLAHPGEHASQVRRDRGRASIGLVGNLLAVVLVGTTVALVYGRGPCVAGGRRISLVAFVMRLLAGTQILGHDVFLQQHAFSLGDLRHRYFGLHDDVRRLVFAAPLLQKLYEDSVHLEVLHLEEESCIHFHGQQLVHLKNVPHQMYVYLGRLGELLICDFWLAYPEVPHELYHLGMHTLQRQIRSPDSCRPRTSRR